MRFHSEGRRRRADPAPSGCGCDFESKAAGLCISNKNLCRAAVAYKLVCALYEQVGLEAELGDYVELAAFATVGDVMKLREKTAFW